MVGNIPPDPILMGAMSYCDSHVESLTLKNLFFDQDDASLRRWNKDNEPHRR